MVLQGQPPEAIGGADRRQAQASHPMETHRIETHRMEAHVARFNPSAHVVVRTAPRQQAARPACEHPRVSTTAIQSVDRCLGQGYAQR